MVVNPPSPVKTGRNVKKKDVEPSSNNTPRLQTISNQLKLLSIEQQFPDDGLCLIEYIPRHRTAKVKDNSNNPPSRIANQKIKNQDCNTTKIPPDKNGERGSTGGGPVEEKFQTEIDPGAQVAQPTLDTTSDSSLDDSQMETSSRKFIREGQVRMTIKDGKSSITTRDRYFFLFSDQLVISKRTSPVSNPHAEYKLKQRIPLDDLWITQKFEHIIRTIVGTSSVDSKKQQIFDKIENQSFAIGWPAMNYVVTFLSPTERDEWYELFTEHIEENRRDCQKKMNDISVRLTTKDLHNRVRSKYLCLDTSSTVDDFIQKGLSHFQIYTSAADYVLVVSRGGVERNEEDHNTASSITNLSAVSTTGTVGLSGSRNFSAIYDDGLSSNSHFTPNGSNSAILVGGENILSFWTNSLRNSIYNNDIPDLTSCTTQFLPFEQLKPQYRYFFELRRITKSSSSTISTSALSSILSTLSSTEKVAATPNKNYFWRKKRQGITAPSQVSSGSNGSGPENSDDSLGIFGDQSVDLQETGEIPDEIWLLMNALYSRCSQVVGIFRKPAAARHVKALKYCINQHIKEPKNQSSDLDSQSTLDLQSFSAHTLAGTLKEYLRAQRQPILEYRLYDNWVDVGQLTCTSKRVEAMSTLITEKLTPINREILAAVISILCHVCRHRSQTNMSPSNCAISLTPSLIWHPDSANEDAKNVSMFIRVIEDAIKFAEKLFPSNLLDRFPKKFRNLSVSEDEGSEHSTNSSGVDSGTSGEADKNLKSNSDHQQNGSKSSSLDSLDLLKAGIKDDDSGRRAGSSEDDSTKLPAVNSPVKQYSKTKEPAKKLASRKISIASLNDPSIPVVWMNGMELSMEESFV